MMAADAVTARNGMVRITISGLSTGRHAIVTYHNNVSEPRIGNLEIDLDGKPFIRSLKPSHRALDDAEVASAYIPVDVEAGNPVVIDVRSDGSGPLDHSVLNGFAIDAPDPSKQAVKPHPGEDDEHVEAGLDRVLLSWTPARDAASHDVYFGTDPRSLSRRRPRFGPRVPGQPDRWPP